MVKRVFVLIIILILLSFSLYGCYDANSIEEYAYVVAIGIDKGETNAIKLTLQFAAPSSSSGNSSNQSSSTSITTVECATIGTGISTINGYISKVVNLSHCQIIAISEMVAIEGIESYIDTLINNIEIRPDCNIIVTKCNASDYIENSNPVLTDITARYYQVLLSSEAYTGHTVETPIWEIESASHNILSQYVTVLGGLNFYAPNTDYTDSNLIDKNANLKPGEANLTGNTKSQVMGLAVFDNHKLIGELDSMDSICYLLLKNSLDRAHIAIPSPFNSEEAIDIVLKISNDCKFNVELVNNTPFITCNAQLSLFVDSFSGDSSYSSDENLKTIEDYASSYMKNQILDFLYKTSKEYGSDIVGFGYTLSPNYATISDWHNSDWHNNYKNSFFKVNVDSNIKGTSLFSKH